MNLKFLQAIVATFEVRNYGVRPIIGRFHELDPRPLTSAWSNVHSKAGHGLSNGPESQTHTPAESDRSQGPASLFLSELKEALTM